MEGTIGLVGLNDRVPSKGKIGSLRNFADRAMNNIKDRSTSRGGEKKRKTQKLTDMYGGPSMRGINNDVVSRRLHGIISSNLQNTLSNNTGTIQHIENNKSPSNFHPSAVSPPPSNYWQTDFGAKRKTTDTIQNLGEAAIRVSPAKKMVRIDREAMARMYRETLIKTQLENQQKLAALKQKRELAQKNNPNQPKLALNKEEQKTENEHREIPTNTRYLRFIKGVENVYQSLVFTIFFAGIIFLSLFLRDFWVMAFNADKDATSDLIIELIFLFFTLESVINSVVFRNYRFSFVFLLDTISTWTIVIDLTSVPFISDDDFRSIKGQLAFKIFKLFNVLKLWRATRLFFRKNQTKRYIPINETTIKMNHTSAVAQFNQIKKMQQIKRQKTEFLSKSNKSSSQKEKGQFPFLIAAPGIENSEQHHLLQKDGHGNLASLRLKNLNEDLNNSEMHGSEVNDSMYRSEGEGASNFDEQPKPRKGSQDAGELLPDAKDTLDQLAVDQKGEGFLSGGDKHNKPGFHAQYANESRAGDKLVKDALLEATVGKPTDRSGQAPNKRKPSQDNIFAIGKLEIGRA